MGAPVRTSARGLLEADDQDADRLIETFNALLAIARAEAGAQHGDWERLDLSELAQRRRRSLRAAGRGAGDRPHARPAAGAPSLGHRQLVAQAIANITDNAVKYTPPAARLATSASRRPGDRRRHRPGIPAGLREHAKQRFVRLDAQRSTPGSGLGLSLVDAVAKLHDAKLDAREQPRPQGLANLPSPCRRLIGRRARQGNAHPLTPAGGDRGSA